MNVEHRLNELQGAKNWRPISGCWSLNAEKKMFFPFDLACGHVDDGLTATGWRAARGLWTDPWTA